MASTSGRFRRADRILRSREFRCTSNCGRRAAERHFVLLASSSRAPGPTNVRLGITVSRRVAGAVGRNRIKRQIRTWFREIRGELRPNTDIVVIARRGAMKINNRDMGITLRRLLSEAGAIR